MEERTPLRRRRILRENTRQRGQLTPEFGRFFARKGNSAEHQNVSDDFTSAIEHTLGIPLFRMIFTERFEQQPNSVRKRIRRLHGGNNRGTGRENGLNGRGSVFCELPEIGGIFDGDSEGVVLQTSDSPRLIVELLLLQEGLDLLHLRFKNRTKTAPIWNPRPAASTDSLPAEFPSSPETPGARAKRRFEERTRQRGRPDRRAGGRSRRR